MLVGNPNGWDDLEQTAVKLAGSDLLASLYLVRHNVKRTAVVEVAQSVYYSVRLAVCRWHWWEQRGVAGSLSPPSRQTMLEPNKQVKWLLIHMKITSFSA